MLAQIKGEDVYTMPDYLEIPRAIHKKLINTMINAKTEDSAARSIMSTHYWYTEDSELCIASYGGKQKRKGAPVFIDKKPKQQALQYMESFKHHHPMMVPAICSGIGVNLQAVDGRLMLRILECHNNVELPVIPIHDEVVVPKTTATMEFAQIALKDAFNEVLGEEGNFGSIFAKWSFNDGTEEKKVEIKLDD